MNLNFSLFIIVMIYCLNQIKSFKLFQSLRCVKVECNCISSTATVDSLPECHSEAINSCYFNYGVCEISGNSCAWTQNPQLTGCLNSLNSTNSNTNNNKTNNNSSNNDIDKFKPSNNSNSNSLSSNVSIINTNIDPGCQVGGCNNEICTEAGIGRITSNCTYMPFFDCYKNASCRVQINGQCAWTQDKSFSDCLSNKTGITRPKVAINYMISPYCQIGGCYNEICKDYKLNQVISSLCIVNPIFQCYKNATCEIQSNGQCGWTNTTSLNTCINNNQLPQLDVKNRLDKINCQIGGCNNEICTGLNLGRISSNCTYKPYYSCYQNAQCQVQRSGKCDWTQDYYFNHCLVNATNSTNPRVSDSYMITPYCQVGGCYGEVCTDFTGTTITSPCIFKNQYKCYKNAQCSYNPITGCGWNQTTTLKTCLSENKNNTL